MWLEHVVKLFLLRSSITASVIQINCDFRTWMWGQTIQLWRGVHKSNVPYELPQQFTVSLGCVSSHWVLSPAEVHRWDRHHFKIMYLFIILPLHRGLRSSLLALPKLTLPCTTCTAYLTALYLYVLLVALYNYYIQSQIFPSPCLPLSLLPSTVKLINLKCSGPKFGCKLYNFE